MDQEKIELTFETPAAPAVALKTCLLYTSPSPRD